jgi:hypothetical protein
VHVLLIADALFAMRERTMLQRLEIGLADEGVRVVQAVPSSMVEGQSGDLFARCVGYSPRTMPLMRHVGVRRLVRSVRGVLGDEEGAGVDVVHAFGGATWQLAADAANELGAPLVCEVWRLGLAARVAELAVRASRPLYLAPDPAIELQLLTRHARDRVRCVPWGVLVQDPREIFVAGRAISVMIIGAGRDAAACAAALTGFAGVLRERDDVMIFCDAHAARRAELWSLARKLGVLDRLSLIEDLEGRRELLLQGDVIVVPEGGGEQRSAVLEAMGAGVLVIAAKDPAVGVLQDGQTAMLVGSPVAEAWGRALRSVLAAPEVARAIALGGRRFIAEHRKASAQVRGVLQAYGELTQARVPATIDA